MTTLDTRIADAFAKPLPSGELATLLDEVSQAEAQARDVSAAATARALDPSTPPSEVAAARKKKEDAEFSLARMATATPRLLDLLASTQDQERAAAIAKARAVALVERDALVKELTDRYPALIQELVSLLTRVKANAAKLPLGQGAEDVARRAPADWRVNPQGNLPSLVDGVRLPTFALDRHSSGFAWIHGGRGDA